MGELPSTLPIFLLPDIPLNLENLADHPALLGSGGRVGLLESLMTASIVDELTDTTSNKNRECIGQGVANTATGFIGGMAGCAMIGQSMINVKSGGRGRLSTFCAGHRSAVPDRGAGRLGQADTHGCTGRDHDHGLHRHVQLVLHRNLRTTRAVFHRHAGHRHRVVQPTIWPSACWSACCFRASSSPGRSPRSSASPPAFQTTARRGPMSWRARCSLPPPTLSAPPSISAKRWSG